MAGLAEASDANYYYVKDTEKLPEIFARELGSLLTVAARELRIEVICPENIRPLGFIGRSEKFENGRAVIRLSDLAAGQNRSLLLRCVTSQASTSQSTEIAQVRLSYLDTLAGGGAQTVQETARVRFTSDREAAQASVNASVAAQREWMLNAVKKEEALAAADAGRYEHAGRQFLEQAARLELQCGNAPASLRVEFENEVKNLRQRAQEFQQGQYGAGARKALQNEAWSVRNSK
jgi:Ca-activated chloride channel family protein